MRILGIDPGLRITGYGIIDHHSLRPSLVDGGVIRLKPAASIADRLVELEIELDNLFDEYKPDVCAIEQLYSHYAHPRTAINLVSEMARRLRKADETIAQLALCDVNERLIHRLVGLAREEGASGPDGLVVRRRPTQQELANMIGSCRETISRAFNQLARDGLIIPRGRSLVVTPALIEKAEKKKAA